MPETVVGGRSGVLRRGFWCGLDVDSEIRRRRGRLDLLAEIGLCERLVIRRLVWRTQRGRQFLITVLVAVFFLISLGAGVAAGPFEFILLIPPVLLASALYDRGSGFVATGLGILALASQLDWQAHPTGHLVALTVFVIVALFVSVFCGALRTALERGLVAQQELQLLLQEQRHRTKNDLALLSS